MKNQLIRVNTKKGLLVAFECAKDFPGDTKITLVRKTGETVYILRPFSYEKYENRVHPKYLIYLKDVNLKFNSKIEKAKKKINRIKVKDLLA
jgi:hypothetical protein